LALTPKFLRSMLVCLFEAGCALAPLVVAACADAPMTCRPRALFLHIQQGFALSIPLDRRNSIIRTCHCPLNSANIRGSMAGV
jgi:hypothetical protein